MLQYCGTTGTSRAGNVTHNRNLPDLLLLIPLKHIFILPFLLQLLLLFLLQPICHLRNGRHWQVGMSAWHWLVGGLTSSIWEIRAWAFQLSTCAQAYSGNYRLLARKVPTVHRYTGEWKKSCQDSTYVERFKIKIKKRAATLLWKRKALEEETGDLAGCETPWSISWCWLESSLKGSRVKNLIKAFQPWYTFLFNIFIC